MNPYSGAANIRTVNPPRMRGDEPYNYEVTGNANESSPHARGGPSLLNLEQRGCLSISLRVQGQLLRSMAAERKYYGV